MFTRNWPRNLAQTQAHNELLDRWNEVERLDREDCEVSGPTEGPYLSLDVGRLGCLPVSKSDVKGTNSDIRIL